LSLFTQARFWPSKFGFVEVVGAEVAVLLFVLEHVPKRGQHGVRHRHQGALFASVQ